MFQRTSQVVLDSVGEMPDAAKCGDGGSDTLGNIARARSLKTCAMDEYRRSADLKNARADGQALSTIIRMAQVRLW